MTKERLLVLLANAIIYIEEMTNVDLMEGDGTDILGITEAEYHEVMHDSDVYTIGDTLVVAKRGNPTHQFKIVEKVPARYGLWPIGTNMCSDEYVPFCEPNPLRGPHCIRPDTLLAVKLPREEVLTLREASACGSTIEELQAFLLTDDCARWILPADLKRAIEILKRITEDK